MPSIAQLEKQREKLEADRKEANEKLKAADARLKHITKQLAAASKAEVTKRERAVGRLANEAGILDWDDAVLLTAFKAMAQRHDGAGESDVRATT